NSTKDCDHPNRYALSLFIREQEAIRNGHHQFNANSPRFHQAAVVEVKGDGPEARKKAKLNVSDNISEALRKLASFASNQHSVWQVIIKTGTELLLRQQHQLLV